MAESMNMRALRFWTILLAGNAAAEEPVLHVYNWVDYIAPETKVYLPLDKGKLPGWKNLHPKILGLLAAAGPGNAHGVMARRSRLRGDAG
jgi:spermidine/putrescine-binding protein